MAAHLSDSVRHDVNRIAHEGDVKQGFVSPDESGEGRIDDRRVSLLKDIALPIAVQVVAVVFEMYLLDKFFFVANNKS